MAKTVFSGLVIAWRRAIWPTSRSPLSVKATTDGVMRLPSALAMTTGSPPSMTATHEFVVPRSIPITLGIGGLSPSWRVNHGARSLARLPPPDGALATVTSAGRSRRSCRR